MSVVVNSGGNATFTILLDNGNDGVIFNWRMETTTLVNSDQVSGVGTNMLTISNVDTSREGEYRVMMVRFLPEFCTIDSPTATLTICEYKDFYRLHVYTSKFCKVMSLGLFYVRRFLLE